MLFNPVNQSLHPRINTEAEVVDEVDDFFDRHIDAIAKTLNEPFSMHSPHCAYGKRQWIFSWRWPFIHTWISTCVCVCEINQIMRQHNETMRLMSEIVDALTPRTLNIDLSQLKPETQLAVVQSWCRTQRGQVNIDDIVAILDEMKD
jgi:hypothetical protein